MSYRIRQAKLVAVPTLGIEAVSSASLLMLITVRELHLAALRRSVLGIHHRSDHVVTPAIGSYFGV